MTKDFKNVTEAFEWFMENVYPNLPPTQKKQLKDVKYDHYNPKRTGVSEKRMLRVLKEHHCSIEFITRLHMSEEKQ